MFTGLYSIDGSGTIVGAVDRIDVLTLEIKHEVRCEFPADYGELEGPLSVLERALERKVDDKRKQHGTKNRAHDQRRAERASVPQVVENLFDEND